MIRFGNFLEQAPSLEKEEEKPDPKQKRLNMIKRQVLMKKVQAVRQGGAEDIVASHEPEGDMVEGVGNVVKKGIKRHKDAVEKKKIKNRKAVPYAALAAGDEYDVEGAVEYFYEEGVTEEELDMIIEEVGDDIVDFIDEERKARKMNVRSKGKLKKDVAKIKADKSDVVPRKTSPKDALNRAAATRAFGKKKLKRPESTVTKATKKAKAAPKKAAPKAAPKKKASKEGIRSKIGKAYKKGVERHKAAVKKNKFASGVKAGVKAVGKAAKDVHSITQVNKDKTVNMQSYEPEGELIEELSRRSKPSAKAKMAKLDAVLKRREERKIAEKEALKTEGWLGKKKEEKKPQKAMDAGARAKRKLARKEYAARVSGSEDNVPDDIREVAPPTAKHERMVKHIKKSYGKKGGLTDEEKSIAYATAWKDYKKEEFEKVDEGVGKAIGGAARAVGSAAKKTVGYAARAAGGIVGQAQQSMNDPTGKHKPKLNLSSGQKKKPTTGGLSAAQSQAEKAKKARLDARKKAVKKIKDDRRERATTIMTAEKAAKKVKKEGEDKKFKADSEKPIVAEFVNNLWEASKKCSKCGKVYTGKSCSCCK